VCLTKQQSKPQEMIKSSKGANATPQSKSVKPALKAKRQAMAALPKNQGPGNTHPKSTGRRKKITKDRVRHNAGLLKQFKI